MQLEADVRSILTDRPGTFGIYARNLGTGETVAINAEQVLPTESAAKTFMLVHYSRLVTEGQLDPARRITITDEDHARGSGVLRFLAPGLQPTLDDLAWLMIIVSDNLATDVVLREIGGAEAVNATMTTLGLETARVNPAFSHQIVDEAPFGTSTPRDLAEVYTHLDERCKEILFRQQFVEFLPRRLPHSYQSVDFDFLMPVRVFNKTGGGLGICVDSGRFETDNVGWVVAAQATDQQDFASRADDSAPSAFADIGELLYQRWGNVMRVAELPTPALVVDTGALTRNLDTMTAALPGARLRPHVKAHKCTALAREQANRGHVGFTCATPRELLGLARAGLTENLLLANESVDHDRLRAMAECDARVTVAVDSEATVDAAARNGIREVLIDVNVGIPRCGVAADRAGALADVARAKGLTVLGTMGYEGHAVLVPDRSERATLTDTSMATLVRAHEAVGGDILSGGGTGTYAVNTIATEIQAGSYALMDTAYAKLEIPFELALAVVATVIHTNPKWSVADCGLKALGMDHGDPTIADATVIFCSDEHVTFAPSLPVRVGDRVLVWPAHVDPTVAYHDAMHLADGPGVDASVIDRWPVDLRGWDVPTEDTSAHIGIP